MGLFNRNRESKPPELKAAPVGFIPGSPEEEKYLTVYGLVKDLTPKQLENLKDAMTDIHNGVKKLAKVKTSDEIINEAESPDFIEDIGGKK